MPFPNYVTTTECLRRAMLSVTRRGFPAGRLSCGRDHSTDHLPARRVVPNARLLEGRRRANEADRQDQFHEEYGACRGVVDVLAAAASVADEFGDRVVPHGMSGRSLTAKHAGRNGQRCWVQDNHKNVYPAGRASVGTESRKDSG